MTKFMRISLMAIAVFQVLVGLLIVINYSRNFIKLDGGYSATGSITEVISIVENNYLNFLVVLHGFILLGFISLVSGFLLLMNRRAGWMGSVFVSIVLGAFLVITIISAEYPMKNLMGAIMFFSFTNGGLSLIPLLHGSVRST